MIKRILPCVFIMFVTQVAGAGCYPLTSAQQNFIEQLRRPIHAVNQTIARARQWVEEQHALYEEQGYLGVKQRQTLIKIADRYVVPHFTPENPQKWRILLARLDGFPADFVLAQAALESNWGQSRFAKQGNNFFGLWCFTDHCGLVPHERPQNRHYEVQVFPTPMFAVRTYMHNLNTHPAYQQLRVIRYQQRQHSPCLSSEGLAKGLQHYAAQTSYAEHIQTIIRKFCLQNFYQCR